MSNRKVRTTMSSNLRDSLLAMSIKPGTSLAVELPDTLGIVYVPRLSIHDAERAASAIKGAAKFGSAAALIVAICHDAEGNRVFNDSDIELVSKLPAATVGGPIIAAYEQVNGSGRVGNA